MAKKFALIGAAGYIAPRHLKAIKEAGGELLAALDISDSAGILDSYFIDCRFFKDEFAFYDFLIDECAVDYLVVCSPNDLHEEHCRNGLKLNADIICEKPLALTLESLENLKEAETYTDKRIYTILQLRLHPVLKELKTKLQNDASFHEVDLKYFTPRGDWYHYSWKGDTKRSGGIATNIGIHFFDLLGWLFGEVKNISAEISSADEAKGILEFERAKVNWHLSTEKTVAPLRHLKIDNTDYNFTDGFNNLHTDCYREILNGNGFTIADVSASIFIAESIRNLSK
jgi:UDP-N-acetyl-2-amino-2-deoxyglucuronate dehydrogenase